MGQSLKGPSFRRQELRDLEQRLKSREEAEVVARGERRQEPPREGEDRTSADKTVAAVRQPEEKQGEAVVLPLIFCLPARSR